MKKEREEAKENKELLTAGVTISIEDMRIFQELKEVRQMTLVGLPRQGPAPLLIA